MQLGTKTNKQYEIERQFSLNISTSNDAKPAFY